MKKSYFFKFFVFALVGALAILPSCKDYDDDISGLETSVSTVKSDLTALQSSVTTAQSAATAAQSSATDALAKANEALAAANAAGDAAAIAALETQVDGLVAEIATINAELETLAGLEARVEALMAELEATNEAQLEAIKADIADMTAEVNGMIGGMITGISFDYTGDDWNERDRDLDFTTTPSRVTTTFGQGLTNPISFVTGQRQATAGVTLTVKVSPANAVLNKDNIKLIRSDENALINNYLVVSKVERAKPLLTRATPTVTGLWDITFELPTTANLAEYTALIENTGGAQYLFALAVENTIDAAANAEARFVVSDFAIALSADDIAPVYNSADAPNDLTFQVRNSSSATWTAHTGIRNRYGFADPVSATNLTDMAWNTVWSATGTPVANPADNRSGQPLLNVEVGKNINVEVTNDDIYAYYITLDERFALESIPSELNAWRAYQYEGLNTVYRANEVANIKVNSATASGDVIGFRVHAINWDGTLVDPDGKAFYVGVGASATTNLDFVQTITAPMVAGQTLATNTLNFTSPAGVAIATQTFEMTIGHGVNLTMANIAPLTAAGTPATTWADVRQLQITGVVPANLEEGVTYNGTLTLNNALGIPVHVTTVTLRKALPTADLGITYKTNIHHSVNGEQVVYGYPLPGAGLYDVTTALNVPATMTNLVVTNNSTYPAISLPTWNIASTPVNFGLTAANIPNAEIGVPYLPEVAPGHGKIYDLTLSRNYGPVLYSATAAPGVGVNYNLSWTGTPALKVEFRSYVQDLAEWLYAGTSEANTPVLKYAQSLTGYSLTNITALPPAGPRINLTNVAPAALQDGRTFTVTGVRVLTGANFTVANEYFTPVINGTAIDFTAVITSTPAGPVPTKIEVTLTDNFGHAYTFVVPKVFNMTLN